MKDLRFTGTLNSKSQNESFDVAITFRCDLLSSDTNDGTNLVILESYLDDITKKNHHEEYFGEGFKRLPNTIKAFREFAVDNNLTLTIANSTGSDMEILNEADESNSLS